MRDPLTLEQEAPLRRLPKKPRPEYIDVLLPGLSGASALMLGFALPELMGADGLVDYAKCALIAVTGGGVSYGINKLAIERGTTQAAIGTPGAKLLSTGSIVAVGAGLFAATYAGFTISGTDRLRLEEFAVRQGAYVEAGQRAAIGDARVIPAVRAIAADLAGKEECERESGCVSGRGGAEDGPFSRALLGERQRAEGIVAALDVGAARRIQAFEEINGRQSDLHALLADDGLGASERRARASDAVMHIGQTLSALGETDPVSLASGYADELGAPAGANSRVDDLRRGYGRQLRSIVASGAEAQPTPPLFPAKAGVSDTLRTIPHFLPVALIVAVVELMFPLTLWLTTYFTLIARLEQEDGEEAAPDPIRRNGHDRPRAGR